MLLTVRDHSAYCYTGGKPFDNVLPTAVFVHGAQHDHSVWALQTRYFAHHGFGVLAVDLPGHGRSVGAPLETVEQQADWLLAVLDAARVKRACLIGHSMGSLIALETTFRATDRVTKLALLASAFPMKVSDALLDAAQHRQLQAIDMVNIWSHSGYAQKPSAPGPGFSVVGGNRRLMQRIAATDSAHVFLTDFTACNAYANGMVAAAKVQCPTLFLLGQQDQMTPGRASAPLLDAIGHAKVTRLEHCGHAMMAEQPDAVLDALFRFASHP